MAFTFEPDVRLRSRVEFTAVQERGSRVTSRYFTLLSLPRLGPPDRLGIIASRRFGGAVARNRAKRRLREIFRRTPRVTARGAVNGIALDLVAIPRRDLLTAPHAVVASEFRRALERSRQVNRS
jgi:ribonuclease P protein component